MADNTVLMEDIFKNWKNKKFVAVDHLEMGLNINDGYQHVIVLADIGYWTEHYDELKKWCKENGCRQRGMTVEVVDDVALSLFVLRWS
jgi:hypothetical protein